VLLAIALYGWGPARAVPVHFNFAGEPNRWGGRGELAGMALLFAALTLVGALALPALSQRKTAGESETARGIAAAQWIIFATTCALCFIPATLAWGSPLTPRGLLMALICFVFVIIGAELGKTGPNPIVGVRTPWTYASRLAWEKANRLAGRLLFWGGPAGLISAPFVPQPAGLRVLVAGVIIIAAVSVFKSWRVWRNDPDHRAAF
jgi:uncharacterized membrane protein